MIMDHTLFNEVVTNSGEDFVNHFGIIEEFSDITTNSNDVLHGSNSQVNSNVLTPEYPCNLDTSTYANDFHTTLSLQDFASSSDWDQFPAISNDKIDTSKDTADVVNSDDWLAKDDAFSIPPDVNNFSLEKYIEESVSESASQFRESLSTDTGVNGLTYQTLNAMVRIY